MNKLKIGIVGCGAIGSSLAKAVAKEFRSDAELVALYDTESEKILRLASILGKKKMAVSLRQLIQRSELVIEAASKDASYGIAKEALSCGRSIMVMSVGGLVDKLRPLSALAKKHRAKVYLPSGAIAGLDALKAAGESKINKVILTTSKNPVSFKGVKYLADKGIIPEKIKKDTVLFSGPAKEAVKYFPQNINVAASLSIAGIGPLKTQVRIIASPSAKRNTHEIRVESAAGDIFTRTENVLHPDNPKTSYLAVLSAIAMLKNILDPVKIGS